MSLHPHLIEPVPDETARIARAAFPKGHPYLTFRDALGTIFQDEDFAPLYAHTGQPGLTLCGRDRMPYDVEARYRHKRDTSWTGYMVHVSETCEPTVPHLLTHVHTTPASVHEAQCTEPIQQALIEKDLARASIWSMRPMSARSSSSTAGTTRASSCGARRAPARDGRCRSRELTP